MKFEIVDMGVTVEQEKIVRLGLNQDLNGVVNLVASNALGETSYLLEILLDGTFVQISGVDENLGFPLNDDGRIVVK